MRLLIVALLCACGDSPKADYLEPCEAHSGCAELEDFCAPELGLCTHICRVPGLSVRSQRHQCVPSGDCPDACCLLDAVWRTGIDGTLSGSGVCVPFVRGR